MSGHKLDYDDWINISNELLCDSNPSFRLAIIKTFTDTDYVPWEIIEEALRDTEKDITLAALNACKGRAPNWDIIIKKLESNDKNTILQSIEVFNECKFPLKIDIIAEYLNDDEEDIRLAAIEIFKKHATIPYEIIDGLSNNSKEVREAIIELIGY